VPLQWPIVHIVIPYSAAIIPYSAAVVLLLDIIAVADPTDDVPL
jgi:hypothetical protein